MSSNIVSVLYLISALLFIFALRGLSHPESSRTGNILGIIGMVIAIVTTLMFKSVLSYAEIGAAVLIGGFIGTIIALKIEMTALPQLVAAFHSLVGLAAGPGGFGVSKIFGMIGVVLASVNIFGGFIVTYRMLSMFKKKSKTKKENQ